jgi:phage N-6-adenine-methyltransferase
MGTIFGRYGSRGSGEYNTPLKLIEMAGCVLGGIDLDPASNVVAQQIVQATKYYTITDNGLTKDWYGNIWLNPPYNDLSSWVNKLIDEIERRHVSSAIMLSHNGTDSRWFDLALEWAASVCFVRGTFQFLDGNGEERVQRSAWGSVFFYYGREAKVFEDVFCQIGNCFRPPRRHYEPPGRP